MAAQRELWDQQEGESGKAYHCFQFYLFLGTGRTIADAYRIYIETRGGPRANSGGKRKQNGINGHWHRHSRKFKWIDRANAWDIHHFAIHGNQTVVLVNDAIRQWSLKTVQAIAKSEGPQTSIEITDTLKVLSGFIPPEVVAEVRGAIRAIAAARVPPVADTQPSEPPSGDFCI